LTLLVTFIGRSGPTAVLAATFTVNTTGDAADNNPGNGVCETANAGECTLRAAIEEANATFGPDAIGFNIPGSGPHTISPATPLPTINQAVIIDGTTQTGASCAAWPPTLQIELEGIAAGGIGLEINFGADGSTIRGLVINRFDIGIHLPNTGSNVVECNFIGTNVAGTAALGNTSYGILIQQISANNIIGGVSDNQRNLISGNGNQISVINFGSAPTANIIQNNYIGTDVTGTASLEGSSGIYAFGTINTSILDNVISGNSASAITIFGDVSRNATGTLIQGNFIGTDFTGATAVANGSGAAPSRL
jgi:CSLREA domain-containing protein